MYIYVVESSARSARDLGPCGPHCAPVGRVLVGLLGPCGPPWALVGQPLVGTPGPLWAPLGSCGPLWALVGRALVGSLLGALGRDACGPLHVAGLRCGRVARGPPCEEAAPDAGRECY